MICPLCLIVVQHMDAYQYRLRKHRSPSRTPGCNMLQLDHVPWAPASATRTSKYTALVLERVRQSSDRLAMYELLILACRGSFNHPTIKPRTPASPMRDASTLPIDMANNQGVIIIA